MILTLEESTQTLTLIFSATFSKYCLFSFCACLGWQHCETIPSSVSQIRLIFPARTTSAVQRCQISRHKKCLSVNKSFMTKRWFHSQFFLYFGLLSIYIKFTPYCQFEVYLYEYTCDKISTKGSPGLIYLQQKLTINSQQ